MTSETQHPTAQTAPLSPLTGERRQRSRARVPAPTILYHPDPSRLRACAGFPELLGGGEALISRSPPDFFRAASQGPPLPLGDIYLSRTPWRLRRDPETGTVRLLSAGSRNRLAPGGARVPPQRDLTPGGGRRGGVLGAPARLV